MDCLHGVLMHNDEAEGDKHKTEDQYLRFKEALDTGERPEIGTKATEDELHKVLMHGGESGHHEEGAAILPEVAVEKGPKDPNEMLHEGMHGEEGVNKHDWDGEQADTPVVHEPVNGERMMHDLMHGGAAHVDGPSASDAVDNVDGKVGPDGGDELMHGILMHGDKGHTHGTEPDNVVKDQGTRHVRPLDGENYMHNVLMHGDDEPGKAHHEHTDNPFKESGEQRQPPGPRGGDLHGVLMHGDSEFGKDHSHDDSKSSESEPFDDILEILNMDLDEQLLRVIDIERLLKKDKEEYQEWILNNPKYQDESMSGSTNKDVGDSILSDIDLMKNRYLKGSNNDDIPARTDDEYPFTADDAQGILDPGSTEPGESEDMRHFLELLGSTEPLNARHKVQQEIWRSKQRQKDEN